MEPNPSPEPSDYVLIRPNQTWAEPDLVEPGLGCRGAPALSRTSTITPILNPHPNPLPNPSPQPSPPTPPPPTAIAPRARAPQVDPDEDVRLAEFVVESHMRAHPEAQLEEDAADASANPTAGPIEQTLLRKYIMYARQNVRPQLQNIDEEKIKGVYAELRRESASGGVHIAVRHIESIIRMAEASARMHLRTQVRGDDVDLAISVLLESVIKSQKYAVSREMRRKFSKYLAHKSDVFELLLFHLHCHFRQSHQLHSLRRPAARADADDDEEGRAADDIVSVSEADFVHTAHALQVFDLEPFYGSTSFTGGDKPHHGFQRAISHTGDALIVRKADAAAFAEKQASAAASAAETARARRAAQQAEEIEAAEAATAAAAAEAVAAEAAAAEGDDDEIAEAAGEGYEEDDEIFDEGAGEDDEA